MGKTVNVLHVLSGSFLKNIFVFSQAYSLSVTFRLSVDPVDFQPTTLLLVYFRTYQCLTCGAISRRIERE
jgi:hypothetical protein